MRRRELAGRRIGSSRGWPGRGRRARPRPRAPRSSSSRSAAAPLSVLRQASTTRCPRAGELARRDQAEAAVGAGDHGKATALVRDPAGRPLFAHPNSSATRLGRGLSTAVSPRTSSGLGMAPENRSCIGPQGMHPQAAPRVSRVLTTSPILANRAPAPRSMLSRATFRPPPAPLATAIVATAVALLAGLGDAAPASGALKRITFGDSARGTKLRAVRLGDPDATRKALVIGSIHGDESEGHEIVRRLRRSHRDTPAVQLWVVTSVNPDGVQAGTRKNANGVDLNRNFSYRWRGGVSPVERLLPGPPSVLRAGEPRGEAPREAAEAPGDDLVPPALGPGARSLPRAGPQAEALRAAREPAPQTLPRTAAARHRDQLAEPPSPRHRVRGRAARRRAAELGGPAPRPGGGEAGAKRGRAAEAALRRLRRRGGRSPGGAAPLARSCAGRRSTATRSPTATSESARWPATRRATTGGAGGAFAIRG